ncbi:ferritin-like domain-containing protein [Comamonas sp. lk]|uniref:ferritin-like domain-containing protein n=1 Tax=Comamonas sp. lk TaxID=2201272 RepID=UPI001F09A054|nr:ferritin-like domain-containing protein [Comamonas sp. lk]
MSSDPADSSRHHWRVEDIELNGIDRAAIEHNEDLFFMLLSASFVETGSDTYANNLAEHYGDHPEISAWLKRHWEAEELQHGHALRAYVEAVWPLFPWQQAYDGFFAEYSQLCTMEELYPDARLELVARCVVETGTTAYYQTLGGLTEEPVLKVLLGHIRNDEVSHFKHFLQYFKQLQQTQPVGRLQIARILYQRLKEMRESDSDVALRHVWAHRQGVGGAYGGAFFAQPSAQFEVMAQRIYRLVSSRLPADMAVRMLLKPLLLPHKVEGLLHAPIAKFATRVMSA